MQYVPRYEPYAEGETISTAIYASIVPRVLDKEKSTAGGRTNFRRFAGLNISDTTSMCIGILGEAYANYGVNGGILMMLVLGCFLNKALAWFINLGKFNGYFLLCLPLIFLQVVKSETELVVVLNHLSKACLVVWLFYFILPRAFGSTKRTAHPQLKSRTMTGRSHAKPTPLAVGAKL